MPAQIANWGIELAFIRTNVGEEFKVAKALRSLPPNPRFFGSYGYFDLAALTCIESLSDPYLVLLHPQITESAPFRFFADQENHPRAAFEKELDQAPAAIVVFAKIQRAVAAREGGPCRWAAALKVRRHLPNAHIFFGLGHSELLIVAGGRDLALLLRSVTDLRGVRDTVDTATPLFSKTTTFPLISYDLVHKAHNYAALEGKFKPIITASCEPAVEREIVGELTSKATYACNIYGKSDFLIGWNREVTLAELAKFLNELRQKWGASGALSKTTTYLETDLFPDTGAVTQPTPTPPSLPPSPELLTEQEENALFLQLKSVRPQALKAALSDMTLRLSACLRHPQISDHYRDMANVFAYLPDLIETLRAPPEHGDHSPTIATFTAERIANLTRIAINQRYAAIEFHPETLAHAHSPLLCDIRTIVAASTCVPHFIFDHLLPDRRASETWAGFVLFGSSPSPQYLDQDILALPSCALFTPIEEWWKVTHEVAHAVFNSLQVWEKIPEGSRNHMEKPLRAVGIDSYHLVNEIFANWFDWKYIFRKDSDFYFQSIWSSWIQFPVVHESKSQYLARSLAVYICPRLAEFTSILKRQWFAEGLPWLTARFDEFIAIIGGARRVLPFIADITETDKNEALKFVYHSCEVLLFFEQSFERCCAATDLDERLHPPYENLDSHIRSLKLGHVVTEPIPDPCHLHLSLLRSLNHVKPPLSTEIAFLFSLEHAYQLARR